jgi:hypothetical protein
MIFIIDLNGSPPGLYKRHEIKVPLANGRIPSLTDGQMAITDPDLESFASIAEDYELPNFFPIKVGEVMSGRVSVDAMKKLKHYVLIENTWILSSVLMKKVHQDCFELSFAGGERMWVRTFGMGEPSGADIANGDQD